MPQHEAHRLDIPPPILIGFLYFEKVSYINPIFTPTVQAEIGLMWLYPYVVGGMGGWDAYGYWAVRRPAGGSLSEGRGKRGPCQEKPGFAGRKNWKSRLTSRKEVSQWKI